MRVLMVCLGNICRSPLAEAIFNRQAADCGLDWVADSAGTSDYHCGEAPHKGSLRIAGKYGLDISAQCSRPVRRDDFLHYDKIIALDRVIERDLLALAPDQQARKKVENLLKYYPQAGLSDVPDPYFTQGFEEVFLLIEKACAAMIRQWKKALQDQEA